MTALNAIRGWGSARHAFHFLLCLKKAWTVWGNNLNMAIRKSVKWFQLFPVARDWHLSWAANRKESNSSGVQVLLQSIRANTEAKYIKKSSLLSHCANKLLLPRNTSFIRSSYNQNSLLQPKCWRSCLLLHWVWNYNTLCK